MAARVAAMPFLPSSANIPSADESMSRPDALRPPGDSESLTFVPVPHVLPHAILTIPSQTLVPLPHPPYASRIHTDSTRSIGHPVQTHTESISQLDQKVHAETYPPPLTKVDIPSIQDNDQRAHQTSDRSTLNYTPTDQTPRSHMAIQPGMADDPRRKIHPSTSQTPHDEGRMPHK